MINNDNGDGGRGGEAAKCRVGATHLHNTLVTQQGKLFAQQEVAQMCKLVEKLVWMRKQKGMDPMKVSLVINPLILNSEPPKIPR